MAVFKTFMYVHLLTIFVASCINLQIKEQIPNFCSAPCQDYFTFLSVSSGLSSLDTAAPCQDYFTFLSVSSGLSSLDTEKRFDN